jgi:hypothetical protein
VFEPPTHYVCRQPENREIDESRSSGNSADFRWWHETDLTGRLDDVRSPLNWVFPVVLAVIKLTEYYNGVIAEDGLMEINGVAHTFITAGDFAAARAFYGQLLPPARISAAVSAGNLSIGIPRIASAMMGVPPIA